MKIKVGSKVRLKSLEAILSEPNVKRVEMDNGDFSIRKNGELLFDTSECSDNIFGNVITISKVNMFYNEARYVYGSKYLTRDAIEEVVE